MAISPGLRHNAKLAAARKLNDGEALDNSPASLHIQLLAIEQDVEQLRALPMTADRVKMKREKLLPKWTPTVEQYLTSHDVHQNMIFSYCVIWLFDIGDFDKGLDWAEIAIKQGQKTPENIRRQFAAFVADTVLEWAMREAEYGHSVEPYFSRVFKCVREEWRLHEEINAKWYKFAGMLLLRDKNGRPVPSAIDDIEQLKAAEALLATAHEFHPAVGVKTLRDRIGQRLRALEKSQLPHGGAGAGEGEPDNGNRAVEPGQPASLTGDEK